jgi:hypothetical protein
MIERYGFTDYREIPTSQRSTEFILGALGLSTDELVGETVLDLGSGTSQQLAQDLELVGSKVVSMDPNLPHSDVYVVKNLLNDLSVTPEYDLLVSPDSVYNTTLVQLVEDALETDDFNLVSIFASEWREMRHWPAHAYGRAVAGKGQALPFKDRCFNRVIATTSVPYGLTVDELPTVLAECNRVLVRGGRAHFWPVVVGGIEDYISLDEIRALIKKARSNSPTSEAKEYLSGFGLEICESSDESWQIGMEAAGLMLGDSKMRTKTLVLTRKVD